MYEVDDSEAETQGTNRVLATAQTEPMLQGSQSGNKTLGSAPIPFGKLCLPILRYITTLRSSKCFAQYTIAQASVQCRGSYHGCTHFQYVYL